ncbi:ankyrin repeat domain-containing protein, partial [bacterium]
YDDNKRVLSALPRNIKIPKILLNFSYNKDEWEKAKNEDVNLMYKLVLQNDVKEIQKRRLKWEKAKNIIDYTDSNGNTILHIAAFLNRFNIIVLLLDQKIKDNWKNKFKIHNKMGQRPIELFGIPSAIAIKNFYRGFILSSFDSGSSCTISLGRVRKLQLIIEDIKVRYIIDGKDNFQYIIDNIKSDPSNSYDLFKALEEFTKMLIYSEKDSKFCRVNKNRIYESYIQCFNLYRSFSGLKLMKINKNTKKLTKTVKQCLNSVYYDESLFNLSNNKYKKVSKEKLQVRDRNGNSLLHIAAQENNIEAVKYLVEYIDSNVKNYAFVNNEWYIDSTPAHIAAKNGNLEILKILENNGFYMNSKDCKGNTILHISIINEQKKVIDYLIQQDSINVNILNINNSCPLYLLSDIQYVKGFKELLKRKDLAISLNFSLVYQGIGKIANILDCLFFNFLIAETPQKKEKYREMIKLLLKIKPKLNINEESLQMLENFKFRQIQNILSFIMLSNGDSSHKFSEKQNSLTKSNENLKNSKPNLGVFGQI